MKCDLWFEFCPQVLHLLSTSMQAVCLHLGLPGCLTATTAVIVGKATTFANSTKVLCCLHGKALIGNDSQGSGHLDSCRLFCSGCYSVSQMATRHFEFFWKKGTHSFVFFFSLTRVWERNVKFNFKCLRLRVITTLHQMQLPPALLLLYKRRSKAN